MRTFRQQFDVTGKSAQAVSRRFAALLKPGTKNFTESLSVRQTIMIVICHKTPGPPLDRAQAMDPGLRASLNGILDPEVFARRQEEFEREDCASSAGYSIQKGAMYGTNVPLGRAAINRAMQVRVCHPFLPPSILVMSSSALLYTTIPVAPITSAVFIVFFNLLRRLFSLIPIALSYLHFILFTD